MAARRAALGWESRMKLLVLDGNSLLNRAYYGIRPLTTKEGLFTNAIYGFLTMLNKLRAETSPDAVAVAFDMRAPTFRHKAYAGYKAQRKGMPEELAQQMPVLKELLVLLGYRLVECEGWEADDILGTLAQACRREGQECVIATGDRDSLQLVGGRVTVRLASTKLGQPQVTLYDAPRIREDYGVEPEQLIEIKAIQGDSSDNIPGVPGIGPKGAGELIQKYHDLDAIYDHLDELDIKPGMRTKLEAGKDSAYLSRMLGTIRTDAPVDTTLSHYVVQRGDPSGAARLMAKLEFFSLMEKMGLHDQPAAPAGEEQPAAGAVEVLPAPADLPARVRKQKRAYLLACIENGCARFLTLVLENKVYRVQDPEMIAQICEDETIAKCTHDAKPLYSALRRSGVELRGLTFDTLLAAYLLNPSATGYSPSRLAQEYGIAEPDGVEISSPELLDEPDQLLSALEKPAAGHEPQGDLYSNTFLLPSLEQTLRQRIAEKNQTELLDRIELPLARVLACMEQEGFEVDAAAIRQYGETLQTQIEALQTGIYEAVGCPFNINSPKQLGEALFGKLGLPHGKKTKTGYSTNAEILESLRWEHPSVAMVLDYRTLTKLKSTYCDGLLKVVGPDGRIHSSFNQTETRTGRISSTEPNLQNIPVRTDMGRELRRFFVARPGWVLVDADYSQIELRVLAHVANDKAMIQAFLDCDDIHSRTAAQVFHMPQEMVTPLMRSRAKAVNFGIVYGIGAFSLSKDIGVTRAEADEYIKEYLRHYSGVDEYMQRTVEQAKEKGYAEDLFGRRRYLPELTSSNFNTRSFGERVARNMPIQGAAADIIKIAMIRVQNRLEQENRKAKLILQVHDELIVEAPQEEAEEIAALLTEEMEGAVSLSVPMVAQATVGKTWYDAKA